ncbi:hypothetical protein PGT21_031641 [Puccinia graminis f. sp. tritici]|uniref:Uncharacterized protein n=1 Tax=Puccinia graminis f. sp. tritici TaxID=56615 RepID=A0A5B0LPY8_PUCGR|nr:hypothetical protein PGT21_031641 [Puccinia graminis f. sp. tritici]KAA1081902.1 hypothetical protein PGTUg99_027283 [Puccinia graminis f. sp. tritici]
MVGLWILGHASYHTPRVHPDVFKATGRLRLEDDLEAACYAPRSRSAVASKSIWKRTLSESIWRRLENPPTRLKNLTENDFRSAGSRSQKTLSIANALETFAER